MNLERGIPRYAHIEGFTNLCFSDDGEYIVTCGSEGDVRIWKGIEDDDAQTTCVGEKGFSVAQKGSKLFVGSDHNYVQILNFPDGDLDRILTRFTAEVNTLDVSRDGNFVAAGSSDMMIHVVEVETSIIKFFEGHKAPILDVSLDPNMEYLSSSSCDGSVRIWKISDQTVVKEWPDVLKSCNAFHLSESRCKLSWEPTTGRLFAIPYETEVQIMQRGTWNMIMNLSHKQTKNYSITSWSNCGRYLAASSVTGNIDIWNTMTGILLTSTSDPNSTNICSLKWYPLKDATKLAFCDIHGQLTMIELKLDLKSTLPSYMNSSGKTNSNNVKDIENSLDNDEYNKINLEDDENLDEISLDKIKSHYNLSMDEDNEGKDDDSISVKSSSSFGGKTVMPLVELQPPFQPTSMPVHLQRRFMVFNDTGFVKHINTEEENVIDVDFHDTSIHHAFRINNFNNHIIASLNPEGLVLASERTEDSTSKLYCRLFRSWDSAKDWSIELDDAESIEAIGIGRKWVVACTNIRFLRIFTLSGLQREVLCIPGPILCINSSDDLLVIVYHSASGLPGEQNLSFVVYQITHDVKVLVAPQPLPLSPKSTLKWVGFSDCQNPCILDSDGIVKLFSSSCGLWKPICVKRDESVRHFVVGISEEFKNIRCIPCKGSFYPSITPHPFIIEIPWQIPLTDLTNDKGVLEEQFWRHIIAKECLQNEDKSLGKEFLTTALKLFALANNAERLMRIHHLCYVSNSVEVSNWALKFATKINNTLLVDKLKELKQEQQTGILQEPNCEEPNSKSLYLGSQHQSNEIVESQELFSESRSSSALSSELSSSLIAKTREKITSNTQRSIMPSRKINPFKKTSQIVCNEISTPSTSKEIDSKKIDEKKSEGVNSTPVTMEESLHLSFPEWYKMHMSALDREHSASSENGTCDLAKFSAQKFRSMKTALKNKLNQKENEMHPLNENDPNGNKKRKLGEEPEEEANAGPKPVKKNAFEKLKAFAFQPKS